MPLLGACAIMGPSEPTSQSPLLLGHQAVIATMQEHESIGLSDEGLSQNRRRLLELVNQLHSVGLQLDMDLPQIVVIGQQSAGKSSAIESISGIRLPRASGTCTRCPTELRLSHSDQPWECVVSLRFITDKNGTVLSPIKNIDFGSSITDPDEVEERLRRAQLAILNPTMDASNFLQREETSDIFTSPPEVTFSANYVSVQIRGPNVADLSFCDLPGLIGSVAKGGNQGDKKLIEDLLISYLIKPSCLILLTVACETDFETQYAYDLVRQYDPERKRTIGALTKPDRIARGDEDRWVRFVQGQEEVLDLGWFSVKQPDTIELQEGITWTEARKREKSFFDETAPWSYLPYSDRQRLGTECLVKRLSDTLSDLISKRLPVLLEELDKLLQSTQINISQLPAPPSSDPLAEMLQYIDAFATAVSQRVEGTPDANGLVQNIRVRQEVFRRAIRATAPYFHPYERPGQDQSEPVEKLPPILFLWQEENEKGDDESKSSCETDVIMPPPIYIDEVMERARNARTRELPDNYPFIVTQKYIEELVQCWKVPVKIYFTDVHKIVYGLTKALIREHFGRFVHSGLLATVQAIVMEQVKLCEVETEQRLQWIINLEQRPFTVNEHYLSDYKDKFLSYYKGLRQRKSSGRLIETLECSSANDAVTEVLAKLAEIGLPGINPGDLPKLVPPDPYDPALGIMASVRAYYQVAYKRFADVVPLCVDHDFVRGFERRVKKALLESIVQSERGDDAIKRCRKFLQETPLDAARRQELQQKLQRLMAAKDKLVTIW